MSIIHSLLFLSFSYVSGAPTTLRPLTISDSVHHVGPISVTVEHPLKKDIFYARNDTTNRFNCTVSGGKPEKFKWMHGWNNGSYTDIQNVTEIRNGSMYESGRFNFPSANITHVVCVVEDSMGNRYNGSYGVHITEGTPPHILTEKLRKPIVYKANLRLTCRASGDPIEFYWLKNGQPIDHLGINNNYGYPSSSELILDPKLEDGDNVTYTCIAGNFLGEDKLRFVVLLKSPDISTVEPQINLSSNTGWVFIALGVCGTALVASVVTGVFFRLKSPIRPSFPQEEIDGFNNGKTSEENEETEQYENAPFDTNRDIALAELKIGEILKSGEFGTVHFGEYFNNAQNGKTGIPVGVKIMKDKRGVSQLELEHAFKEFLREIKLMQSLGSHVNVVSYIGAVTSYLARYTAYLVVEYCYGGDIATYVRSFRNHNCSFVQDISGGSGSVCSAANHVVPRASLLTKWCRDIAAGMEYIHQKKILHRDLAGRNVLLATTGNVHCRDPNPEIYTVKIADFGLSRDLNSQNKDYYPLLGRRQTEEFQPEIRLPLAWMSVEALETLKFTTKNDVWAFGITMWEIWSLGKDPFKQYKCDDQEIASAILANNGEAVRESLIDYLKEKTLSREPVYAYASDDIWNVMKDCWNLNADERPDFSMLKESLDRIYLERSEQSEVQINEEPTPGYSTVQEIDNESYERSDDEESDQMEMENQENEQQEVQMASNVVYLNAGDLSNNITLSTRTG